MSELLLMRGDPKGVQYSQSGSLRRRSDFVASSNRERGWIGDFASEVSENHRGTTKGVARRSEMMKRDGTEAGSVGFCF
jgi:hypothetical protein